MIYGEIIMPNPIETISDTLEWSSVYIKEALTKPVEYRKEIWTAIVARQGLQIAEYLGSRLNIDDLIVSAWIKDCIAAKVGRSYFVTHQEDSCPKNNKEIDVVEDVEYAAVPANPASSCKSQMPTQAFRGAAAIYGAGA